MDKVDEDDSYSLEQCGHVFHTDCIVRNIQVGNIDCPCCRRLPPFVIDKEDSSIIRRQLILEYNQKRIYYYHKKAVKMIHMNSASETLKKIYKQYLNEKEKEREYNDMIKRKNELYKLLRKKKREFRKNMSEFEKKYKKDNNIKDSRYSYLKKKVLYRRIAENAGYIEFHDT
tara:strand:- start:2372 stop:2887 length:516 start_codon:yes stop_codon:yes gene_type:complete